MNLTPNEVLIIAVVALIVLGPQRLPEAARQIGKGYRELRKMSTSVRAEIDTALKEPVESITKPLQEIKNTISEPLDGPSGTGAPGVRGPHAGPAGSADSANAPGTSDAASIPNSSFRPADELPADELPDAGSSDGGPASS